MLAPVMSMPTGSTGAAKTRGERTRERILDAVLEIVALEGPGAVTYRAVAARAGVALGVMTYHFASRSELLSGAFRLYLERLRSSARALPLERVRDLSRRQQGRLAVDFVRELVSSERVSSLANYELMLELARDPELRASVDADTATTESMASELVRASGSKRPREDALLISAAIEGLVLYWLTRPDDAAYARRIESALRRLVDVFFPEAEG